MCARVCACLHFFIWPGDFSKQTLGNHTRRVKYLSQLVNSTHCLCSVLGFSCRHFGAALFSHMHFRLFHFSFAVVFFGWLVGWLSHPPSFYFLAFFPCCHCSDNGVNYSRACKALNCQTHHIDKMKTSICLPSENVWANSLIRRRIAHEKSFPMPAHIHMHANCNARSMLQFRLKIFHTSIVGKIWIVC